MELEELALEVTDCELVELDDCFVDVWEVLSVECELEELVDCIDELCEVVGVVELEDVGLEEPLVAT